VSHSQNCGFYGNDTSYYATANDCEPPPNVRHCIDFSDQINSMVSGE
jgi:hypothetical protein